MASIKAELDVIKLLKKELNKREGVEKFNHQLACIKNSAGRIQGMIKSKNVDDESIHKATDILCKDLGILWRNVFYGED